MPSSLTPDNQVLKGARADVLEFYRSMPFNLHETAEEEAKRVSHSDIIDAYPILERFLRPKTRVLEVGCGTGWLSNAIALKRGCNVTGIDFNPVAVERSSEVARIFDSSAHFTTADLFNYEPEDPFQFVISLGVLHHTDNCLGALERICRHYVRPGGHIFIGLYHTYGRKPFLDHFKNMQQAGHSEVDMLQEYKRLHKLLDDDTHIQSWFRDQVLHPHETQHTLAEVLPVLESENMELRATSINNFEKITTIESVTALEKDFEQEGLRQLEAGNYYPGFFLFLARKKK